MPDKFNEPTYKSGFRSESGVLNFSTWYQDIMSRSDCSYETRLINTRYGQTHVAVTGDKDAPPVVFLHGWSGNGMLWDLTNRMHTVAQRYRIYLVDVIGQPNNSSPITPAIRGDGYGNWMVDVLDGLEVDSARFVGMSMGGLLVMKLAAVAPERIAKAVLMGPAGFSRIRFDPGLLISFSRPLVKPSIQNVSRFLNYSILGPSHRLEDPHFEMLAQMFLVSFRDFRPGAQIPYVFSDQELQVLKSPTMLLCGKHDALFDAIRVENRAKAWLPNLEHTEILGGLGHAIGNYGMVTDKIRDFFGDQ